MTKEQKLSKEDQAAEANIQGDVLESILCHVPLIHLLSASHVSKSWNHAVFSSLRHFNKPKPWLIVHAQSSRPPYATTALAYDPRSNLWLRINQNPPIEYVSALRSSNSTLLYMLSLSKFSFSFDPLHLTWHHVDPPLVWRTDPIVAMVGRQIIVAGGACDFEDDPLSVEIYDLDTRKWDTCESMPAILKDSAASTWLSVAANSKKLYAMEQVSGIAYSFDPSSRIWSGPFDLRHDQNIYFSVIGIFGDKMIMVGLLGNSENVKDVKIWELKGESFKFCKEIGVMPKELVEKLKGKHTSLSSIKISLMDGVLYIYNPEEPEELVVCEINGEGVSRWGSLKNAKVSDGSRVAERTVLTCADVALGDLGKAVGSGKGGFSIVNNGIFQ
ncbi:F-box/kelch-repeat protein At1g23390-like [Durio zibethinus]|uniref:F-box/kelch-repeat protein At1g23390-like n=1 Tax=Durio zibethinus TaxID=66656 RepID=A0A6P5Y1N4_DURZI|nr:F-box/kelch-repeat protein At1g23390-like [Durio zibethinus]